MQPALEGGFADGRLVGAGALAALALLFEADLGASLSSRADLRISSAWAFEGDSVESRASAMFEDEDLSNVGVGRGFISAAVDGRLLELPSREESGRLNGSSRRGGIMNVRSPSTLDEPRKGAVEGLSCDVGVVKNRLEPVRAVLESVVLLGLMGSDCVEL